MVVVKEKKGLRIDSATIGMESARSYQALGATVRRFTVKDYQQSLANNNSLNAAVQGENEEGDKERRHKQVAVLIVTDGFPFLGRNAGACRNLLHTSTP